MAEGGGKVEKEKKKQKGDKEKSKKSSKSLTSAQFLAQFGYDLGRTIGEGSYAKVKLAKKQDEQVAIKIVDRDKAPNDFVLKFLPRELETIRRLSHSNIIEVDDVLEHSQMVYIVMEYAQSGDLLDHIKRCGRIGEGHARSMFREICEAVKYCHDMDICHRDLKCENILLDKDEHVKVSDFGFARSCVDRKGKRILSETFCGSAAYASPEVLERTKYNPKMYDVWSLGVILYIMVCGSMPFDDSNVKRMLDIQKSGFLEFPPRADDLGEEVVKLIRHMLEVDIIKRATLDQVLKSDWLTIIDTPFLSPLRTHYNT